MKHFDYFAPTEIIFGAGRVTEAGALAARYGKKAMLVTVPEFPAVAELYAKVKKSLADAGVACVHYDGVIPNPTTELVTRGAELAKAEGVDVVIGLGGGSSDAAAALLGAAHLWGVPADDPRIEEAARSLGADVAFFLHGGCACFTGVGDAFDHALAPMNGNVVLVKPEGGVSTAAAYRAFDEHPTAISEADREAALEAQRAADVPLRNNLVPVSEHLLPALVDIRLWASERADVQRVLMSGSGSAVFMQCATFADAGRVAAEARMRGWWARATMFGSARAAVVPNR